MMMNLFGEIAKNAIFVLEFLAVVVVIFVAAKMIEKMENGRNVFCHCCDFNDI